MINRNKVLAILMCICLAVSLAACGDSVAGGLGQLTIGKGDDAGNNPSTQSPASPTSGGGIPDLGGNGSSTPTPTRSGSTTTPAGNNPTPTPYNVQNTPTPIATHDTTTTYYTDSLISMKIPYGWKVHCQAYDSGLGLMRLMCCICDPNDRLNQIFFCTALEPIFDSEAKKAAYLTLAPNYTFAPVISAINAGEVLKSWPNLYTGISMTDATRPKLSQYLNNFTVTEMLSLEDGGNLNGGYYSCALAKCVTADNKPLTVSFTDLLVKNSFWGYEFYISYANFLLSVNSDVADIYLPVLTECINSLDTSGFQNYSGSTVSADSSIMSEYAYTILPKLKINYDLLK